MTGKLSVQKQALEKFAFLPGRSFLSFEKIDVIHAMKFEGSGEK